MLRVIASKFHGFFLLIYLFLWAADIHWPFHLYELYVLDFTLYMPWNRILSISNEMERSRFMA